MTTPHFDVPGVPVSGIQQLEREVLGSLLIVPSAFFAVDLDEALRPDDFSAPQFRHIYGAMRALHRADSTFDATTVRALLQRNGHQEAAFVVDELDMPITALADLKRRVKFVRDAAQLRALQQMHRSGLANIEAGEPTAKILADAEAELLRLALDDRQRQFITVGEALADEQENLYALSMADQEPGIPTPWRALNDLIGGWRGKGVTIVGARPSMGKSAFVVNVAEFAALAGFGVALFSMEMDRAEISQRLMSARSEVRLDRLSRGKVRPDEWGPIMEDNSKMAAAPLYIDDIREMTIADLRARARRLAARKTVDLVVVDYLQLLSSSAANDRNRVQAMSEITRGLKILAGELGVPVIALSQLSRKLDDRPDKRPVLTDLRDSGSVEQDADNVLFLFREEYYDKDIAEERKGIAEVIVAKQRNGQRDVTAEIRFVGQYVKFVELEECADTTASWGSYA